MYSYEIRYSVYDGRTGARIVGPVSEVVTAANDAEARAVIRSRYPSQNVTIVSTRRVG